MPIPGSPSRSIPLSLMNESPKVKRGDPNRSDDLLSSHDRGLNRTHSHCHRNSTHQNQEGDGTGCMKGTSFSKNESSRKRWPSMGGSNNPLPLLRRRTGSRHKNYSANGASFSSASVMPMATDPSSSAPSPAIAIGTPIADGSNTDNINVPFMASPSGPLHCHHRQRDEMEFVPVPKQDGYDAVNTPIDNECTEIMTPDVRSNEVEIDQYVAPQLIEIDNHSQEDDDQEVIPLGAFVNLIDSTKNSQGNEVEEIVHILDDEENVEEEWSCPRCTLLNSIRLDRCEACQYSNVGDSSATSRNSNDDSTTRAPDPTRTERLVIADDDIDESPTPLLASNHSSHSSSSSAGSYMGGGALLGSVIGAAGAYVRGHSVRNGALEGAVTGAVGGALVSEVMRDSNFHYSDDDYFMSSRELNGTSRRRRTVPPSTGRRISTSYPSSFSSSSSRYFQQEQVEQRPLSSSFHSRYSQPISSPVIAVDDSLSSSSLFPSRSSNASTQRSSDNARLALDQQRYMNDDGNSMDVLLRSMLSNSDDAASYTYDSMSPRHLRTNSATTRQRPPSTRQAPYSTAAQQQQINDSIDTMSYDRLLELFGDGTENISFRGANASTIDSLPAYTISNASAELPLDKRQCMICLEDFKNGDARKVMPCLHGFHCDCLDKWLRMNGCCPICKHDV